MTIRMTGAAAGAILALSIGMPGALAQGQMAPLQDPVTGTPAAPPAAAVPPAGQVFPVEPTVAAPVAQEPDGTAFDGSLRPRGQQDQIEMPMTALLNRLSSMGFAQYRSITRVGDTYRIEAVTTSMDVVTIEADAQTGEIRQLP